MALYTFSLPLLLLAQWMMVGLFIKDITIFGVHISYIYFLVVSVLFVDILWVAARSLLVKLYDRLFLYQMVFVNKRNAIFALIVDSLLDNAFFFAPIFLVLNAFFNVSIGKILLATLLSLVLIIPAMAFAFLFMPLALYFRGEDIRVVIRLARYILSFLIPSDFTYLAFNFYDKIKYIPLIGFVEEIRRLVFFNKIDMITFAINGLEILVMFIVGLVVFNWTVDYARRKGWIGLR